MSYSLKNTESRMQHKVLKVEFDMGENDITDIHAGGPARLSFWVSTNLPQNVIKSVARDREVQAAIKTHGGSGYFTISEAWADSYIGTKRKLKERLLHWVNQF